MKTHFPNTSRLIKGNGISEMTANIAAMACELSGCSRSCLVLKEGKTFIIRAGFRESQHGIGKEVSGDGKKLLQQVLDEKMIMINGHPGNDQKTHYIHDLVKANKISAIMFVPLFYNNTDIGVLTIDAVGRENTLLFVKKKEVEEFASFCSILLWKELEKEKVYKDIRRKANLSALGEQGTQMAHTLRNILNDIIGPSDYVVEELEKINSLESNEVLREARRIQKRSLHMNAIVSRVLKFGTPLNISLEKCSVNEFLREIILSFNLEKKGICVIYELDKHLYKTLVLFDQIFFGDSVYDIIANAIQAGSTKIVIKTMVHPDKNLFRILIGNNGKMIPSDDLPKIFDLFFTTKSDGTGAGLANVWKIVTAHDGVIEARSGNGKPCGDKHGICTWFDISLPLKR